MPIRKKGDIDIRTSANGAKVKQTGYTFYSYDKKSAALYFQFRGQDGQPTDLGKATIHLVMILNDDGGKEFIPKSDEIEVISAIRGTAKYVLPEMLLSYSGKVTGYVYMDFDDGSQTDDGQFTFRIKHSMITHVLPAMGDKYVQDFEDVKEHVEQAGDSATKDIKQAKDDAESQIGDYVGEVESAKDSAVEDIDKALPEVEDKLDEVAGKISELDISDTNLLKGTSDEWEEITIPKNSYGTKLTYFPLEELSLKPGDSVTLSEEIDNTIDDFDTGVYIFLGVPREDRKDYVVEADSKQVKLGDSKTVSSTITIPEKATEICIRRLRKDKGANKVVNIKRQKLNRGTRAAPWTPAPEDIVLKSELEKIKQAIINLGGSI